MLNVRDEFENWLLKSGHTKKYAMASCVSSLERASEYIVSRNLYKGDVWTIIDSRKFNDVRNKLMRDKIFKMFDKGNYKLFEKIANLYYNFLKHKENELKAMSEEPTATAVNEDTEVQESDAEVSTKKMTITEAAVAVLRQEQPRTVKQILQSIIAQELYLFKAATPSSVLTCEIRTRCDGVNMPSRSGQHLCKLFKIVGRSDNEQLYALIDFVDTEIMSMVQTQQSSKMKTCPRCELNYILVDDELCAVCKQGINEPVPMQNTSIKQPIIVNENYSEQIARIKSKGILSTTDDIIFPTTIREIGRLLFNKAVGTGVCSFWVDKPNKHVWVPRFYNPDSRIKQKWDNVLSADGTEIRETLKENYAYNELFYQPETDRAVFSYHSDNGQYSHKFIGIFRFKERIGKTSIFKLYLNELHLSEWNASDSGITAIEGSEIEWDAMIAQQFEQWFISKGKAANTSRSYRSAMNTLITKFHKQWVKAQEHKTAVAIIDKFYHYLVGDNSFIEANRIVHNQYSAALNAFVEFIQSLDAEYEVDEFFQNQSKNDMSESPSEVTHKNNEDLVKRVIEFVKSKRYKGADLDEIVEKVGDKQSKVQRILEAAAEIIEIKYGHFIYHEELIDLDEARSTMLNILQVYFVRFGGVATSKIFYDAVKIRLEVFLNDNDFDDEQKVYLLAKYFFSKTGDEKFQFYYNCFIWQTEPEYQKSIGGLLVNFAQHNCGFINKLEAIDYLSQLKLSMQISQAMGFSGEKREFVLYDKDEYLYLPAAGIDGEGLSKIQQSLLHYFEDNPEETFIIIRDIDDEWLSTLPQLPNGKPWTQLLLQDIIGQHDIGFETIKCLKKQDVGTLQAALVRKNENMSFADVVWDFINKKYQLPREFGAEELRLIIRDAGMLANNELWNNMHNALNERRFVWQDNSARVKILALQR